MPTIGHIRRAIQDNDSFEPIKPLTGAGTTISIAFYRHRETGKMWIGKITPTVPIEGALRSIATEFVANSIYSYFGVATQHLCFSDQMYFGSLRNSEGEFVPTKGSDLLRFYGIDSFLPESGQHLMTEIIPGFKELGHFPRFNPEAEEYLISVEDEAREVPLRGLGSILAVAALIQDTDVVGGSGANVGYVYVRGEDGEVEYAQAVKIDPGEAFHKVSIPARKVQIANTISDDLPLIDIELLNKSVKQEFMETMAEIVSTPESVYSEFFGDGSDPIAILSRADTRGRIREENRQDKAHFMRLIKANHTAFKEQYAREITVVQESINTQTQNLSSHLNTIYKTRNVLKGILGGEDLPIGEAFINVEMVKSGRSDEGERDRRHGFIDSERIEGQRTKVEIKDLLSLTESSESETEATTESLSAGAASVAAPSAVGARGRASRVGSSLTDTRKHITVYGRAGVGKSSFSQYITHLFAQGELWAEQYNQVILIPLRLLSDSNFPLGRPYDLYDVIGLIYYGRLAGEQLKKDLAPQLADTSKTLFILDGLDETRVIPEYLKPILNQLLNMPHRLVLTRPSHGHTDLTEDARFEITGFNDENVKAYIDKFFKEDTDSAAKLHKKLKSNSNLWSLAHTPITLALMCHSSESLLTSEPLPSEGFAESKGTDEEVESVSDLSESEYKEQSLSDIYKNLLLFLGTRLLQKSGTSTSSLPKEVVEAMALTQFDVLQKLALKGMKENKILFEERDLRSCLPESLSEEDRQDQFEQMTRLGVLTPVGKSAGGETQYSFVHLSFQEYLAALALKDQFIKHPDQMKDFFKEYLFNEQWWLVIEFLCGAYQPTSKIQKSICESELNINQSMDFNCYGYSNILFTLLDRGFLFISQILILVRVEKGLDLDFRDGHFKSTLAHRAARNGNLSILKILSEHGARLDIKDNLNGGTPLHCAAQGGHIGVLKFLRAQGVPFSVENNEGKNIAFSAASCGRLEVLKFLKGQGLRMDIKGQDGQTIFHAAAHKSGLEVIIFLLEQVAIDVTCRDNHGFSVIDVAMWTDAEEEIKFFLEKGVPIYKSTIEFAAADDRIKILEILMDKGSSIDTEDNYGQIAAIYAAWRAQIKVLNYLAEKGIALDKQSDDIRLCTPAYAAADQGHIDVLKFLKEKGVDLGMKIKSGDTLVHCAVSEGQIETLKYLFDQGVALTVANTNGDTPAHSAAGNGQLEILKYLVDQGVSLRITNTGGETPAHYAANNGQVEILKYLLDQGVSLAARNQFGETPAHFAAHRSHINVLKFLNEKGIDLAVRSYYGRTLVHHAVEPYLVDERSSVAVLKFLIDQSVVLSVKDFEGKTPTCLAVIRGKFEMMKILVEQGVDLSVTDIDGRTFAHHAANHDHADILRVLIEQGVDLAVTDNNGMAPAHCAANHAHVDILRVLIEQGVDLSVKDNKGWTPAHFAANKGHIDIFRVLVEQGVDLSITDNDGATLAHLSAFKGHIDVLRLLAEQGVDLAVTTNQGITIMHLAALEGHVEILKFLKNQGMPLDAPSSNTQLLSPPHCALKANQDKAIRFFIEEGLLSESDINTGYLSSLPVLGWMFSRTSARSGSEETKGCSLM